MNNEELDKEIARARTDASEEFKTMRVIVSKRLSMLSDAAIAGLLIDYAGTAGDNLFAPSIRYEAARRLVGKVVEPPGERSHPNSGKLTTGRPTKK